MPTDDCAHALLLRTLCMRVFDSMDAYEQWVLYCIQVMENMEISSDEVVATVRQSFAQQTMDYVRKTYGRR